MFRAEVQIQVASSQNEFLSSFYSVIFVPDVEIETDDIVDLLT